MRKFIALSALAGLAVFVFAQVRGADMLASYAKALNSSKSVSATMSVQPVGGAATTYKIDLAKPNMVRIDGPKQLIVSDGKTITTLDKSDNSYYKKPFSEAELKMLFANDDTSIFAPFFDANAFAGVPSSKSAGVKNRRGVNYNVVDANMDKAGKRVMSFYLDPKDSIARMAEVNMTTGNEKTSIIVMAKDFTLDGDVSSDAFAFKAPADAREVPLEELNAAKWFHNLDEAKAMAKKTGKKIFVDFMASWCGPCKMLDRDVLQTADFRNNMGKHFVFCKIDVDEQPAVAQQYGITAMPTQMVLDAEGGVVSKTVGYGGPERFYSWLKGSI